MDDNKLGLYIAELNTYRQKNNVALQYHELLREGPPHNARFTIQVIINNRKFPEAKGKTKREAKNAAAKLALQILNDENKPSTTTNASALSSQNYIGLVNSIAQKKNLPVNYEYKESKDSETNRFHCRSKIGEKEYEFVSGSTKREAKHLAAKAAYKEISKETPVKIDPAFLNSPSPASSGFGSSSFSSESSFSSDTPKSVSEQDDDIDTLNGSFSSLLNNCSSKHQNHKRFRRLAPAFNVPLKERNKYTADARFLQDFTDIERIGSGGYSEVFKAKHKIDAKIYVIKRVKYDSWKVEREVQALAELKHTNIVQYYGCWGGFDYDPEHSISESSPKCQCLFIQMEFCDQGTLDDWINERRSKKPSRALVLDFFRQIIEGVHYIHGKGFIHRDLKPSNIFLVDEKQIKIGDFGLVTSLRNQEARTCDKGTRRYMSPEQIASENYGNEVDIFSLGLILAELLYIPTTFIETCKVFEELRAGTFSDVFDDKEKNLLRKLLSNEASKRPKTDEILSILKKWMDTSEERKRNTC